MVLLSPQTNIKVIQDYSDGIFLDAADGDTAFEKFTSALADAKSKASLASERSATIRLSETQYSFQAGEVLDFEHIGCACVGGGMRSAQLNWQSATQGQDLVKFSAGAGQHVRGIWVTAGGQTNTDSQFQNLTAITFDGVSHVRAEHFSSRIYGKNTIGTKVNNCTNLKLGTFANAACAMPMVLSGHLKNVTTENHDLTCGYDPADVAGEANPVDAAGMVWAAIQAHGDTIFDNVILNGSTQIGAYCFYFDTLTSQAGLGMTVLMHRDEQDKVPANPRIFGHFNLVGDGDGLQALNFIGVRTSTASTYDHNIDGVTEFTDLGGFLGGSSLGQEPVTMFGLQSQIDSIGSA